MGNRAAGDILFENYLRERGIAVPPHEPDLGVTTHPDYVVERNGATCVCEVEEFAPTTVSMLGGMESMLKPIRAKIREAARQLKPLEGSGMALAVVIANPHNASVIMGDREIVWGMYGDPVVRAPVSSRGTVGEPFHAADRNGKLTNDHPYISAVIVLGECSRAADAYDVICAGHATADDKLRAMRLAREAGEVPDGSYGVVSVYKTASPTAVPLPDGIFDGSRDRIFEFDPERGAIIQTM
jgi:hypothetical protein